MNRIRLYGAVVLTALTAIGTLTSVSAQTRDSKKPAAATTGDKPMTIPKKVSDAVVLEVGNEKFSVGQIADVFKKNANRGGKSFYQLDRDSALAFLDLYARYRLKVQAAVDAGLDRKQEVIDDLASNRMQLAVPPSPQTGYLIERRLVDPAVERIFKMRGEEVRIAVIFSAMRTNDPADTARAFRRTIDMLNRLRAGEDFTRLVFDSSDDRTTAPSGGQVWITGGMLFAPMEAAAYETKVGNVYGGPIRVPAGFVILKVTDRRPRERVRAAHIFFDMSAPDTSNNGAELAKARAEEAYKRLRAGESFEKLAREISSDRTSGANGGDLGSYYTRSLGFEAANGKLWHEFEDVMFDLKDGEYSEPVRTEAGYHIIKRIDTKAPQFEEEKETIRALYKQQFLSEERSAYVASVIARQGLKIDNGTLTRLLASVQQDRTAADTAWASGIASDLRAQTLYTFGAQRVTVGAWIDSVESRRELRVTPLHERGIRTSIAFLVEPAALAAEAANLESEYPEFASLMKEFRDGILIFKLEEDLIWSKLKFDEEQGAIFWQKHRAKYRTEPRLALTEIFLYKPEDVKAVQALVASNPSAFDSLAAAMTQRANFREKRGKWALSGPKNADIVRQVLERTTSPKPGTILPPFEYQSGQSIVRIDEYEAPREMTYEEAKPEVMSDYIDFLQKKLQDEWIETLKLKYRVKIDDKSLNQALAAG